MAAQTRIELPGSVEGDFQVFLNGVEQVEGRDYVRDGSALLFDRELKKEGRLGLYRWLSMLLGIHGTYRQNDVVDFVYEQDGRRQVAADVPFAS